MEKLTKSVCPVCFKTVAAQYTEKENRIYLEKHCKEHGYFSSLISREAGEFKAWHKEVINVKPRMSLTNRNKGCPHDCGPCDAHLQTACCVLLDVTNRCDQACPICFASAGRTESEDTDLAEIKAQLDELARLSEERKFNIQLSGGEPAVRNDLPQIIQMAKEKGFEYVQLNTNGRRIAADAGFAGQLADAGLDAVFLQFDGTRDEIYDTLRGERLLAIKKNAVENCREAMLPVALVPTVVKGVNDQNIGEMVDYMLENLDVVRGIHFQPVSLFGRYPADMGDKDRITLFDIMNELELQTGGRIEKRALLPLGTGHNLCCFYGSFMREEDGSLQAMGRPAENEPCCAPDIEIIKKDRDYVKNRWQMAQGQSETAEGFDRILEDLKRNSFTLTGMAFQDAFNFDVQRVSRCRVQVFSEDRKLIPFCTYNLTNLDGNYLYRK